MDKKIEINLKTIIISALIVAGAYLIWRIQNVLFIVLVAYLISAAVRPFTIFLNKKLPRKLAIMAAYLIVIAVLVGLGSLVFPPLIAESSKFYSNFPQYFDSAARKLQIDTSVLGRNIEEISAGIVKVLVAIVSNTVEFITIFVVSIYLSLERKNFRQYLIKIFAEERGEKIHAVLEKIEERLGKWIRGQLLLCLVIGATTWIGLTILQFPYAVPLAVMAGILEAVPNIGPILSSIPAIIIGLSHDAFQGLIAAALYFLIQQLENNIVVPRIMSSAIGLRPLAIIIVLLIGGSLMGTIGIILAIPVFLAVQTIVEEARKPN